MKDKQALLLYGEDNHHKALFINRLQTLFEQIYMMASSFFCISSAEGRNCDSPLRMRCCPIQKTIGAAINTDELVPITMPNNIGNAKLATALPPATAIGINAKNVVTEVNTVRVNVDVILSLSNCNIGLSGVSRRFSRTRSNTTTLSLTE